MTTDTTMTYNDPHPDTKGKGGLSMKGKVKTREKCPKCGRGFEEVMERVGRQAELILKCRQCGTRPETFFIIWYHPLEIVKDGKYVWIKNHRISRHPDDGQMLRDNVRANRLLGRMRDEEDSKPFDIANYIQPEIAKFDGRKLLVRWYRSKCKEGRAPSYRDELRRYIRAYYAPLGVKVLPSRDCRDIRTHHIDDLLGRLPNVSEKTRENIMSPLKKFCRWLHEIRDVLKIMPVFPVFDPPKPKKKWITEAVRSAIIAHMHPHDQVLFGFWKRHPMRNGELRVLRVRHFDSYMCETETGYVNMWGISIEDAISNKTIRHRKNKEPYIMPLDPSFDLALLQGKPREAFVFLNRKGKPYTQGRIEKIWKTAQARFNEQMKEEGKDLVVSIRPYWAMRRSTATHLRLFKKAQLDDIRRVLGQRQLPSANEYADVDNLYLSRLLHGDGTQMVHSGTNEIFLNPETSGKEGENKREMERVAGLEPAHLENENKYKSKG